MLPMIGAFDGGNAGRTLLLQILAVSVFAGCSASTPNSPAAANQVSRSHATEEVVLREPQLNDAAPGRTVYEALAAIRPDALMYSAVVVIDGQWRGDPSVLRSIPIGNVGSVRLVPPRAAIRRFGRGYQAGAILLLLKHRGP